MPSEDPAGGSVPGSDPVIGGEPGTAHQGHLVDLSPLRESPAFARLWFGGAISAIGSQMTIVAAGLQIYIVTKSTFAVALVALFALPPMIIFGLYGGVLADSFDRRKVALFAAVVAWSSTVAIAIMAWTDVTVVWPLYILVTVNAVAATVIGSTRQAIAPRLLPIRLLPAAAALMGISVGISLTLGPALAGVLVGTIGIQWAYTIDAILFIAAFAGIITLPSIIPEGELRRPGIRSVIDGIGFLRRAPNVRMSFIVDIVAMLFGQPRVLFPAIGSLLIGGGAFTVGILTAAGAVGALLSSIFSGQLGLVRWQGRAVGHAIVAYGGFIAAFGVLLAFLAFTDPGALGKPIASANLPALVIACVFLAGAGAADNVSAIFRGTILQAAVPDGVRGRLQGIFTVVVTSGPRLGDLFVGILALTTLLWLPPLLGGVIIMVLIATLVRVQGTFRHYDALEPTP